MVQKASLSGSVQLWHSRPLPEAAPAVGRRSKSGAETGRPKLKGRYFLEMRPLFSPLKFELIARSSSVG